MSKAASADKTHVDVNAHVLKDVNQSGKFFIEAGEI